ncbi:unnamed protein product [Urochloa decumbens]|uniref:Uncharacterized protein n=1 Tax=Urochloa decumbens TaxID=240449 RepID=A0ABC9FEQ4_9POAL
MAARRSVLAVIVFRPNGAVMSGSGFVIRRNLEAQESIVLTSSHTLGLVEDEDVLRVRYPKFPRGVQELPATILYQNATFDVAILRVGLTSLLPLRFAMEDATIGESVVAVGYCDPDNLLNGLTFTRLPAISPGLVRPEGILCDATSDDVDLCYVVLSCVCLPGMSGGPVLSRKGVIGMVDSGDPGYTNAVSPDTILGVLKLYLTSMDETLDLSEMTMEEVLDMMGVMYCPSDQDDEQLGHRSISPPSPCRASRRSWTSLSFFFLK